jgi:hypothetical protein
MSASVLDRAGMRHSFSCSVSLTFVTPDPGYYALRAISSKHNYN